MTKEIEIVDQQGNELDLLSSKKAQIMVATFFVGIVPLGAGLEALGLGIEGLAIGGVTAGLLALAGPALVKRFPGINGVDWREVGLRLIGEETSIKPTPPPANKDKVVDADPPLPRPGYSQLQLRLGELLSPHVNQVLSNRIAILGMPGAGKSNLVAKLCERLASFGVPLIIFDTKPEYGSMCDRPYFRNPLRASVKNLNKQNARAFAKQIMGDRLQVVIDLRSYRDDNVAAEIMIDIIESVWEFEEARTKRLPCMFVLDEAHYWLSQGQQMSNVSKKEDKETGISLNGRLQATFFNLVNLGRSFGMGSIIATQRPANIDKRATAPAEWKFLMKANQPQDIAVYKDYGFDEKQARLLDKGQAFIIGPGEFCDGAVYQIEKRESPDEAETPGIENLQDDDTTILPDDVETLIASLPAIDKEDTRYLQGSYGLSGIRRAPAYEHTTYQYPVYSGGGQNTTVYNPVYSPLNGSTSRYDGQQDGLINEEINVAPEPERVASDSLNVNETVDTSKVSPEKRDMIKRLAAMGIITHRDIAKAAKLDGPKYPIYKQVCIEEGIEVK